LAHRKKQERQYKTLMIPSSLALAFLLLAMVAAYAANEVDA
jgi:hypothetical protein